MKADILKRLTDIEAKRLKRPRADIFVVPAENHRVVTGFSLNGSVVALRQPGEGLEALQARSSALVTDTTSKALIFVALH